MMRQEDLTRFADLEGGDIEQFMSPRDDAQSILSGAATSLRRPEETSRWFSQVAAAVLSDVRQAEAAGISGNEALSTVTDLRILAGLANYYAARLPAAVSYNIYRENGDLAAFDQAIEQERAAVAAWEGIVKAAGDVYSDDLPFGVHRVGFPRHWREELAKLQQGLEQLKSKRREAGPPSAAATQRPVQPADAHPPRVRLEPPGAAHPGQDLVVTARAEDAPGLKSVRLRYRHLTQFEDYQAADMAFEDKSGLFAARIPGAFITAGWDLMYFVEAIDNQGNGRNYPDLEAEAPYVIVPVERPPQARLR